MQNSYTYTYRYAWKAHGLITIYHHCKYEIAITFYCSKHYTKMEKFLSTINKFLIYLYYIQLPKICSKPLTVDVFLMSTFSYYTIIKLENL